MKKFIYIFLIIVFLRQICLSQQFEFTPINIDFKGIETKGDTIAVYGDLGSMFISYNNAESWQQKRVFDKGIIIKMFLDDNQMLVFNDLGQICESKDNGHFWELMADFNDSVFAVIRYPDGYFMRSNSKLMLISNDFKLIKIFPLYSPSLDENYWEYLKIDKYNWQGYRKSLAYFKGYLFTAADSNKMIKFDLNLQPLDTIYFEELSLCNDCYGNFQIEYDSSYCYINIGSVVYRTNDFNTVEMVYDSVDYFKLINNKIYLIKFPLSNYNGGPIFTLSLYQVVSQDSAIKLSEYNNTYVTASIRPKDFIIKNDKLILIGLGKLIMTINIKDNTFNLISEFSSGIGFATPDRVNDSTYIYYSGFYFDMHYDNYFYITENKGLTFKPAVDSVINPEYKKFKYIVFKYYDEKEQTLYFGGIYLTLYAGLYWDTLRVITTRDLGKSFTYDSIPDFDIYRRIIGYPLFPASQNLFKRGNNFILPSNTYRYDMYNKKYKDAKTKILTYDKNFNLISEYIDSNYVINYLYSKDTNSFIIHAINFIEHTREFRYTSDKGLTWELIKKYTYLDTMMYYKEIKINKKSALAMFLLNYLDSNITLEVLDFETRTISKVYSYNLTNFYLDVYINNGICTDNDTIYIAIEDTLFYTTDIYDRNKWEYINFPNNGRIIKAFMKFGDMFYARYLDDNYSVYDRNIYWIKITDLSIKKPVISSSDYDFGRQYIEKSDTFSTTLRIENTSQISELIITRYSILNNNGFLIDLPLIDSLNPLVIKPGKYFDYNVFFKPTELKEYRASIVFYSNANGNDNISYLRGEGIDSTTDVIDVSVEVRNYLYAYPPFPIPAKNYVKTLIYWDLSLDIDKDEIAIYNIYGEKIEGRERIRIDKKNINGGYLVWDCSDVESGIYFIKISHGTKTLYLKVMVDR